LVIQSPPRTRELGERKEKQAGELTGAKDQEELDGWPVRHLPTSAESRGADLERLKKPVYVVEPY